MDVNNALNNLKTYGASQTENPNIDNSKIGLNKLTSQDFLKLLITQLQNQDPTNPTDNAELLNQLSNIRSLQSSLELDNTLKGLTLNEQLSQGASLIGKQVTGKDSENNEVTGIVDRVSVREGSSYIGIGNSEVQVGSVTKIASAP